jgi:hypothetical protein
MVEVIEHRGTRWKLTVGGGEREGVSGATC